MSNWLKFLGFGDDYEEDEDEEYAEEESGTRRGGRRDRSERNERSEGVGKRTDGRAVKKRLPQLVFFRGIPSEESKLGLRDALLGGAMVLLDLQGLESERLEEGRSFINFMGGVAFAHKGKIERIGPSLFLIAPREGMLQWWVEGE
ncbi:MAG: cell division protein SepF [Synergistaceae bacterium]|nr:cell division protein SepF [Synergistaceae bacterium]